MNIKTRMTIIAVGALMACLCVSKCAPKLSPRWDFISVARAEAQATINQNKGGLGAYAAMHPKWPCAVMMQGFKGAPEIRLSVLWNTFGNNFHCIRQFAADPRPKYLQVHLINEVCQRNKRCGPYELLADLTVDEYKNKLNSKDAALISKIKNNVLPVAEFFHANSSIQCSISAGLESNLPSKAYRYLVDELKPLFPQRCTWVWSPVGRNAYGSGPISGMIYEGHGDEPKGIKAPCIVNLDGVDIELKSRPAILPLKVDVTALPRFLASFASCEAAFFWIAEFNGIGRGGFVDPRKRNNWPTSKTMEELQKYNVKPIEAHKQVPWSTEDDLGKAGCKTYLKIKDGDKKDFLWKQSEPPVLDRGAVVFLPRKYNTPWVETSKVYVMQKDKKVAKAYERSRYTEDGSNRQFFRFHKKAEDFPYNVVVHFGNLCAVIPNPKKRND